MKKRNILIAGAVLAASAVTLAGCAGSSSQSADDTDFSAKPTGTLKAWGFDNADDVGTSRLDFAAEKLGNVTVDLDATPFDAQKFTTLVSSGNVPDVVQIDRRFAVTYAAQGLIQPLTKCYDDNDVDADSEYYKWVVDDVRYKDDLWAVPQFYQPPAIIVNTRVLDAAGITPDQIDTSDVPALAETVAKMYQTSGGNPTVLGLDPVAAGQPELWVLGQGGQLVDGDGKPTLDEAANVTAIENLKMITDAQGGYAKIKSFSDSFDTFGDNNQFVTDQVGAQVDAQWYPNVLIPYADQIEITGVPFRDSSGKPFAAAMGTAFVIPTGAANPSAACTWMLNLTSTDAWMAAADARVKTLADKGQVMNTGLFTGNPTADKQIRERDVNADGNEGFQETIDTFYEAVDNGKSVGASPVGQQVKDELTNAITSTLLGDKSAADALTDAQDAVMRAYDQLGN